MTNKCWCEEPLVAVLLRTPWRDAGVQPVLHCPEHGDLDSRASLVARAEKAEASVVLLRKALVSIELQSGIQAAWQVASKALEPAAVVNQELTTEERKT